MKIDFTNKEIVWFDEDLKRFSHKPISTKFKEIEVLRDGRILIIEDYYEYHNDNYSNLYCLSRNLAIDWFLEYPNEEFRDNSGYVGFSVNGENLYANTFNCVRVKFDYNGKILDKIFTK